MHIFQSEQVLQLRNVVVLLEKTNGQCVARSQTTGLSCGPDAGTLLEIHAKTVQHCRAEDCLAIDME